MEALFYDHDVENAATRLADLRQALRAFLVDTSSRSAVQMIVLLVRIPTPSTVTLPTPRRKMEGTSSTTTTGASAAAAAIPSSHTSSPASATASRRCRRTQKLAWCCWEADRRIRQATQDAAELNKWIAYGAATSTRAADQVGLSMSRSCEMHGGVVVVAAAYLAPQTRDDLTIYESWQRCAESVAGAVPTSSTGTAASRSTRQLSPLRCAGLIFLSFGSPTLLLSWAERLGRCHLDSLLLPRQSLLLDFSWWVSAASSRRDGSGGSTCGVSEAALRDIFVSDVQPCLRLPKGDRRCGLWLSYATLLSSLHPRHLRDAGEIDGRDCSGRYAVSTFATRRGRGSGTGGDTGVDSEAFVQVYAQVRQLLRSLAVGSSGSLGRTQFLRVLLSFGDSTASLRKQLVQTSVGAPRGLTRDSTYVGLLRSRSLVDVHALFGVLAGQDRVDFYGEAAAFVRTARRRATADQQTQLLHQIRAVRAGMLQTAPGLTAAKPPGEEVPRHALALRASSTVVELSRNTFVERGAQSLTRKGCRWARKYLDTKQCRQGVRRLRTKTGTAATTAKRSAALPFCAIARKSRAVPKRTELMEGAASAKLKRKRGAERDVGSEISGEATAGWMSGNTPSETSAQVKKKAKVEGAAPATTVDQSRSQAVLQWSEDVVGDRAEP